ncbi:hypothetical protein FALCPG4_004584 [Fusarium falciforme]
MTSPDQETLPDMVRDSRIETWGGRRRLPGKNTDPRNEEKNTETRRAHRNTAGVFYYMRRPEIWSKFVEIS